MDTEPFRYAPWMSISLFATYTIVYLAQTDQVVRDLRLYVPPPPDELYRLYSYSLVHGSDVHYAVNAICLVVFGTIVEVANQWRWEGQDRWRGEWALGLARSCAIHALSVVGGAFAVVWEHRIAGFVGGVVGASAGVYGLAAGQIGFLALNWARANVHVRLLSCTLLTSTVASEIAISASAIARRSSTRASYSAHVGGFVSGALAGLCLTKAAGRGSDRGRRAVVVVRALSGALLCAYHLASIVSWAAFFWG